MKQYYTIHEQASKLGKLFTVVDDRTGNEIAGPALSYETMELLAVALSGLRHFGFEWVITRHLNKNYTPVKRESGQRNDRVYSLK